MDCYKPLRIKNQYTGKYLHVDCRNCPACLVRAANHKAFQLSVILRQYKYKYFITLTYDNNHVPYVLPNMMSVFRGQDINDFPEVIGYLDEPLAVDLDWLYLQNHSVVGSVGVLWYYDVQCFLKRFRKYINKYYGPRKFKYFAVGEYGTRYGRPHYHLVIFSDELLFNQCQSAAFACWTYHNWDRFFKDGTNEACKRCDEGCAAYISSYVNCNTNSVQISNYKQFRQKTWRSKDINFGLDVELLADFKKDVIRIAKGYVSPGDRKPFYYVEDKQVDNVSVRLFSSRYVYTFFHKFKGWCEVSDDLKFSRAYGIIECCRRAKQNGISLNSLGLKSDDLSFYRAYVRFNVVFADLFRPDNFNSGFNDFESYWKRLNVVYFSISDYLILMIKVLNYYKSCLLYEQMKTFETLGKDNYFLSLIDTSVEVPEKRGMMLLTKIDSRIWKKVDVNCPPLIRTKLDGYVLRYKKRLLPKHLNDVSGFLNQV